MIDPAAFKAAMGSFPAGVVIATSRDADDRPVGFTASSFSSVSLDPPLVLVCLAKSAACYVAFQAAQHFAINILRAGDDALALRFATRGAAKFEGDDFTLDAHRMPLARRAITQLSCRKHAQHDAGDHIILVGQVEAVQMDTTHDPMVYFGRSFWRFDPTGPHLTTDLP
ncbi:MAG: flavin reductase family protein [Burkholderiales bacterium]